MRRRGRVFAARFLEPSRVLNVPAGHYDPQRQVFVRNDDDKPVFVNDALCTQGGDEITTHHDTTVNDVTFRDPDNG